VKVLPAASKSGSARTSAGIFSLRKVPPPGAGVAIPGARDGTGIELWSIFMPAESLEELEEEQPARSASVTRSAAVRDDLFIAGF